MRPSGRTELRPVLYGRTLIVILESRRVACIDPHSHQLKWVSDATDAAICGQPMLIDGALLIVDESGQLTAINLGDGHAKWRYALPVGAVPTAAAVPFGPGRFLVPLDDGTVLVVSPDVKKQVAEVER